MPTGSLGLALQPLSTGPGHRLRTLGSFRGRLLSYAVCTREGRVPELGEIRTGSHQWKELLEGISRQ